MRPRAAVLVLSLAAGGCQDVSCHLGVEQRLVLAAGPQESAQGCLARAFTDDLNQGAFEYHATVLRTSGAVDSLVALRDGRAELAIATADVLAQAVNGEGVFAGQTVSARTIATLYTSSLHLLVLDTSDITGFSRLRDRTVGVGPPGSGMDLAVSRALSAALLDRRVTSRALPWPELATGLDSGALAALLWLDGVPSPALEQAAREGAKLRLLNTASVVPLLQRRYGQSLYQASEIPTGTYGRFEPADAVAVSTVLVARHDLDETVAFAITSALFRHATQVASACPAARGLTVTLAARPEPAALHPGAALYYRQSAPTTPR